MGGGAEWSERTRTHTHGHHCDSPNRLPGGRTLLPPKTHTYSIYRYKKPTTTKAPLGAPRLSLDGQATFAFFLSIPVLSSSAVAWAPLSPALLPSCPFFLSLSLYANGREGMPSVRALGIPPGLVCALLRWPWLFLLRLACLDASPDPMFDLLFISVLSCCPSHTPSLHFIAHTHTHKRSLEQPTDTQQTHTNLNGSQNLFQWASTRA